MTPELTPFEAAPYGVLVRGVRGGTGPPALLLHGTAGSWRNFRPWLPTLLPRAHLIIPDLPGFGDSPTPRLPARLDRWARLAHALVAELGAEPRVLVGLGLGASVALAYLGLHAGRETPASAPSVLDTRTRAPRALLTHLVLHTPVYYPGALHPALRRTLRLLDTPPAFALVRAFLDRPSVRGWLLERFALGDGVSAEDARLVGDDFRRASLPVLRGLVRDMLRQDYRPLLRTVATPTLVMVGAHDPFVRLPAALALQRLMPAARVVVQSDLGHGWTTDAVAEQTRLLAELLDGDTPGQRPVSG